MSQKGRVLFPVLPFIKGKTKQASSHITNCCSELEMKTLARCSLDKVKCLCARELTLAVQIVFSHLNHDGDADKLHLGN